MHQELLNSDQAKIAGNPADSSKVGPSFATKVGPYLEAIMQPPVAGGTKADLSLPNITSQHSKSTWHILFIALQAQSFNLPLTLLVHQKRSQAV